MMQCIIDHLENFQTQAREKIRSETLTNLKCLDPTGAIKRLKISLQQAEEIRKTKLQQWTKNKRKRPPPNNDEEKPKSKKSRSNKQ